MVLHRYYPNVLAVIIILSLVNANLGQLSSATKECMNYCSIGGVCLKSNTGPKCICLPEWTGERCDIPREPTLRTSQIGTISLRNNLCTFAPPDYCQNDGVCYVNGGTFACHCHYPYIGDYCENEEISECWDYCLNNGYCRLNDMIPRCTCMPGWTGIRCGRLLPTTTTTTVSTTTMTTTSIACNHVGPGYYNSGTCITINNRAYCQCPPNYTGIRCNIYITATPPPPSTTSSRPTLPPRTPLPPRE